MSLPAIFATGNAVADTELRFTAAGKAIARFRLACNQRVKDAAGEWRDGESCFLSVTVFGPLAEAVAESVCKGTKVTVTGRLQQRSWETKEGERRTDYEVLAEEVSLGLKPAKKTGETPTPQRSDDPWAQAPSHGPGNEPQTADAPF